MRQLCIHEHDIRTSVLIKTKTSTFKIEVLVLKSYSKSK